VHHFRYTLYIRSICATHRGDEGPDRAPRYLKACLPFLIRLPLPASSPRSPFGTVSFLCLHESLFVLIIVRDHKGSTRSAVTRSLAHGKWTYVVEDERFPSTNVADDNAARFLPFIRNKKEKEIFYCLFFFKSIARVIELGYICAKIQPLL